MANTVNVNDVVTAIRRLADMENTQFVVDAEIIKLLDWAYKSLYNEMAETHEEYFTKEYLFSTVSGTDDYALPSDFYKLSALDVQRGSEWRPMYRWMLPERNNISYGNTTVSHYLINGSNVRLFPDVEGIYSMRMWYIPVPATLAAGGTFDAINGWDAYLAHDVAIILLQKEESDTSVLMARKNEIKQDIIKFMASRDGNQAPKIRDIQIEFDPIFRWWRN